MNSIHQTLSITMMNLRNLSSRVGSSMVIVVGIAGVVAVLITVLSMAKGFEATLKGSGFPDRAIVMRGGSESEMSSGLSIQQARLIESNPWIETGQSGVMAAGEIYVIADIRKRGNNSEANMPMRGVEEKILCYPGRSNDSRRTESDIWSLRVDCRCKSSRSIPGNRYRWSIEYSGRYMDSGRSI